MSEERSGSENLEFVRAIFADWERGDFGRTDWADPEIELVDGDGPEGGRFRGLSEAARAWSKYLSAWENLVVRTETYREVGPDRVLVLFHNEGRGKTSGLQLEDVATRPACVLRIRDQWVTEIVTYFDRGHAFADLGLEQ